jgi:hypothetical protein
MSRSPSTCHTHYSRRASYCVSHCPHYAGVTWLSVIKEVRSRCLQLRFVHNDFQATISRHASQTCLGIRCRDDVQWYFLQHSRSRRSPTDQRCHKVGHHLLRSSPAHTGIDIPPKTTLGVTRRYPLFYITTGKENCVLSELKLCRTVLSKERKKRDG